MRIRISKIKGVQIFFVLLLTHFFCCKENPDNSIILQTNKVERTIPFIISDSFAVDASLLKNLNFIRFYSTTDSLYVFGVNSEGDSVVVIDILDNYKKSISLPFRVSSSPYFNISMDTHHFYLSNGYEFGMMVLDRKGELKFHGLSDPYVGPDQRHYVISHFDLYNDTHIQTEDGLYMRVSYKHIGPYDRHFYNSFCFVRIDSINQEGDFELLFKYPEKYLDADFFHPRNYAFSACRSFDGSLLISIPTDTLIYRVESDQNVTRIPCYDKNIEINNSYKWDISLKDVKSATYKDAYYTYLLANRNSNHYYRMARYQDVNTLSESPLVQEEITIVVILDSAFNKIGNINFTDRRHVFRQVHPYKKGILVRYDNDENDKAIFHYIEFLTN